MANRKKTPTRKRHGMRTRPQPQAKGSLGASGVTRSSSRSTLSGPATPLGTAAASDAATAKLAGTEALAAKFPFNAAKSSEFGDPPVAEAGKAFQSPDLLVSASSLSETNASAKLGSGKPPIGSNPSSASLDRVRVDSGGQALTTNQGVRVADNQNSLKAGLRGPTLLEDFILREKITHFDHERIPERIVHARGSAAHGYFECYKPLTAMTAPHCSPSRASAPRYSSASSTVAGERGSADTAREYAASPSSSTRTRATGTSSGNNIPVFFIQDAMKFPDSIHAVKPEPHHAMPQAASAHDTFWDFVSLMPESDPHVDVGHVGPRDTAQLPA